MTVTDSRPVKDRVAATFGAPAGSDSLTSQARNVTQPSVAGEGQDSRPVKQSAEPESRPLAGQDPLSSQSRTDAQTGIAAEGQGSPQAIHRAAPLVRLPAGTMTAPLAKARRVPMPDAPEGRKASHSQRMRDAHVSVAVAADIPGDQGWFDTHWDSVAGELSAGPPATDGAVANHLSLADPLLALAADVLDDLERVRIANENRLRQLTRTAADKDGEERGFGLDETHPDVARLAALVEMLCAAEHQAELNLCRLLRAHPLAPWVKAQKGIGDKQAARLLAAIGDPYWNDLHERPRLVSELWSYCGFGNAATQRLRKGQKANWNATARMRAYLVAVSCMKAGGPYRDVYDESRAKYADAIHPAECIRCGPKGNPAQPGTPLSDGHKHARALRAVAKTILRDMWREARDHQDRTT